MRRVNRLCAPSLRLPGLSRRMRDLSVRGPGVGLCSALCCPDPPSSALRFRQQEESSPEDWEQELVVWSGARKEPTETSCLIHLFVCVCVCVCVCVICTCYIVRTRSFNLQSEDITGKWGHFGQSSVWGCILGSGHLIFLLSLLFISDFTGQYFTHIVTLLATLWSCNKPETQITWLLENWILRSKVRFKGSGWSWGWHQMMIHKI